MRGGVVFDFDGLLLDTETQEFVAWQTVFRNYGVVLEPNEWAKCVGGGNPPWSVTDHLAEVAPGTDTLRADREARAIRDRALLNLQISAGALAMLDLLDGHGIPFGIASSSRSLWVQGFLGHFELQHRFGCVVTYDMVGAKKPDPAVYRLACESLAIDPAVSLAFEDSPKGIAAAKALGMAVIAIPNQVTRDYDLSQADEIRDSLAEISVADIRRYLG